MRQSERVYATLKSEIVDLTLAPGAPLPESELVSRLEASRTPVREALQRLASEGLVRLVPGRGAFVTEISITLVMELFQLRECLESFAARLAARSAARNELAPLVSELEALRAGVPPERIPYYFELTHRLDAATLRLAGNSRLDGYLGEVWDHVQRVRNAARSSRSRIDATVLEHLDIVTAIVAGDEDRAARAVSQHVQHSLQNFLTTATTWNATAKEIAL